MKRRFFVVSSFIFGVWLFAGSIASIQTVTASQVNDKNERGRKLYYQYCASCHGIDASGNGPVAATLKTVTPSLKNLKGPDGKFPSLRVQNIIAGEVDVPSHGLREMPVWGRYFSLKRGDKTAAKLDIYALTKYLESFQPK